LAGGGHRARGRLGAEVLLPMSTATFSLTTRIGRPAAEVFAWHERPGALPRLCPPWERVELVSATGGVRTGARVTVRNRVGPFGMKWQMEHRDYIAERQFRDVQLSGPFAHWSHLHRVEPDGAEACTLTDSIAYRLPGGRLGQWVAGSWVHDQLTSLFRWRHAITRTDNEVAGRYGAIVPRQVLIAGASGLVGRSLAAFLTTQGHAVRRLVRRAAVAPDEIAWDPARGRLDPGAIAGVDAIVNLSGENVAGGRWSAARRQMILHSRVETTRTLVEALSKMARQPAVLVNASAVGFYGDRGDETLEEGAVRGQGFLPDVCLAWERAAEAAEQQGVRIVLARLGVVLTPAGGALQKMLPPFRLGVGGHIGTGRQWLSWISIDDAVGALYHAIITEACRGPVNVVAPAPVTNAEFSATLAEVLRRPAFLPVPTFAIRALFGEMADGTLLASTRVRPRVLTETGYRFRHSALGAALSHTLGRAVT